MLELHTGKHKIYVNPQYIVTMSELTKGTKILVNTGKEFEVIDDILDIIHEIQETKPNIDLNSMFGGQYGS